MIERTLVIGATGFVGRAVVGLLQGEERRVVAMRRWNSPSRPIDEMGVRQIVADLDEPERLRHALSGVNHVVYCAAPDRGLEPDAYRRRATLGIRRVLAVARDEDVERVVVTSSAVTIGRPDREGELADESRYYLPGEAGDHFVEAAYAVEQECFRESADGQEIVIVNPTIVLGPGAVLPARSRLGGGSGEAPVNWVDRGRVARAHLRALEAGRRGRRYIVAGQNGTLDELYGRAEAEPGVEIRGSWIGHRHPPVRNRYLLTDGQWIDAARAERELGLEPAGG